uniref:Anaphase-promoting complex subunit 4 WD40 domain-containing protein n=1 Tax=Panagrolaimus superbus TaxID=310955 RepID=A0A914YHG7_9BILA
MEMILNKVTLLGRQLIHCWSSLRRASVDLIGRGFTLWQPHLDISKVLLGLLDLAALSEKQKTDTVHSFGAPLPPAVDASRTARHALSLIAAVRSKALITALSMEVARYNSAAQHQTIQHNVVSPLIRSRTEVLRIIEQLTEKQYNDVADLIIPVGDILVHCLDIQLLKQHSLAELFPPIAKFYMIAYCPASRRIAFGGKNGSIVVHELKTMKSQTVQAHNNPITAVAFSQDGKFLAAYASKDAKITFWQTQQSFLGMGQSQMRLVKTLAAPTEFAVLSPGGTYQPFRARLVWINAKSLTLMLPNGRENRFQI